MPIRLGPDENFNNDIVRGLRRLKPELDIVRVQDERSIGGTHHHVSARHLSRYLAEFDYRYTTRKDKVGRGQRKQSGARRVRG